MRTVDDLRTEHDIVLEVLGRLERAVSAAERGALVPAEVFTDIQEFFTTFVDRCHHGKEEAEVLPRLKAGAYADLAQRLEEDTARAGDWLVRMLRLLSTTYRGTWRRQQS